MAASNIFISFVRGVAKSHGRNGHRIPRRGINKRLGETDMHTVRSPRQPRQWLKDNIAFWAVLLTTFIALALAVVLTFGSFYSNARQNAVTIGSMTVAQEARRIEDALSADMNTLMVSSYAVDSMLKRGATSEEIRHYLVQQTQGITSEVNPDFSGIYGVIQDIYVDGIGWQPEEGYDPYTRPWYMAAAETPGDLAIVSPYIDAQTGNLMLSFSRILSDGKSAVSLDARLDNIYAVAETIQLNGKGYCFLVDRKGNVVAHRDHAQVGKNYLSDPEFASSDTRACMERIYASAKADVLSNVRLNGSDCMVFTHNVQDEWYVVLVVDSADLFKDTRVSLIHNILISLGIFVMVGYFCTSNYKNRQRAIRYAENIRIDVLTGLNNRGEFDRYLNTTVSGISMESLLYLMLFDADGFKSINDRFGHQEGDRALRLIAKALMAECHGTDWFCARYGGDEFVIICKCHDEAVVRGIASSLNNRLRAAVKENRLPYEITMSCGYARFDPAVQTIEDLVDEADQRLYRAKAQKGSVKR